MNQENDTRLNGEPMVYWNEVSKLNVPFQEHSAVALQGRDSAQQDAADLAGLFEQYYDRIARYIAVRIGNRDAAEDMAGEVFLRAVESIDSLAKPDVPAQAWLFRVAHNLVVDHYRRNSRRPTVAIDDAMEIPGATDLVGEVELRMDMERVNAVIVQLNDGQQEVIALRFMGGLSAEEAGAVMGRTSGAIRELQRTALKAIRALLNEESSAAEQRRGAE
jgi:RNA polymerase sigma-70 factor, ECF subfamily